ncbi:MAG: DUF6530 family protein [Oscillospiraceae bacterium]|jgi:hypothetical protein
MKIPTALKHKPVFVVEDYTNIDGRKAGTGDARGMSLGLAQWNERGNVDISAKVWRHTGGKWSRQSEELPLHRLIDLAIITVRSIAWCREAYRYPDGHYRESPVIDRIGLQGDAVTLAVAADNPYIDEDLKLFLSALSKDDELLGERLTVLSNLLKEMGY